MSATPTLDDAHDRFELAVDNEASLSDLAGRADFDSIHFFLRDALDNDVIDAPAHDHHRYALLPYHHPNDALDEETFQLIEDAGYQPASIRDLLTLAIDQPELQRRADIVALGTLRTRRIYDGEDRPGETVWDQQELDRSICQWAVGLSHLKNQRTLVPMELFLKDLLNTPCYLLVCAPQH